jgi:hypothetical protein
MTIPKDAKDIPAIREFLNTVRTQVCSLADLLDEPWKGHFNALKKQYDEALNGLPPSDQVPAAMDASRTLNSFFHLLSAANSLNSQLGSEVNRLKCSASNSLNSAVDAEVQRRIGAGELVAKADVDGKVNAAIEARTKTGDLVVKETVTQLCSQAKELGFKDGEKKVRDEVAETTARKGRIDTRKAALQTAGLPVPDAKIESLIGGTDEEFNVLKATAESRIAGLQKKGIALNSKSALGPKVWLPEEQWTTHEALITEHLSSGNPLATPPAAGADEKIVMIC